MASLWAAVWLPAGVVLELVSGLTERSLYRLAIDLGLFTALGAASGASFAFLLALLERHRSVQELSARRLAIWGATAGAAVPIGVSLLVLAILPGSWLAASAPIMFAALALLGAACAGATLAIARRNTVVERTAAD